MSGGSSLSRAEEDFRGGAARLAGMAGAVLGWRPGDFWQATPAELGGVVAAIAGDIVAPPGEATLAQLREAFPDG